MTTSATEIPPSEAGQTPQLPMPPLRTIWGGAFRQLVSRPLPLVCLIVVLLYVAAGLFSFLPVMQGLVGDSVGKTYESPSLHTFALLLGTDIQGRSVLWRVIYGARVALTIAVLASIISLSIGVALGVIAGYFGKWIDDLITWLYTTVSSIPWILLVLALVFALKDREFFGQTIPELYIIIFALGFTDWVGICRLVRGETLKHRDQDYVTAARAVGAGHGRIIFKHILPNVFHLVIITFSLGAVGYVQAEVALTFLGLGISAQPSWGRMIDDAKVELLKGVWWQLVAATIAIGVLSLALNILGDVLRDALDPRLRGVD